MPIRFRCAYCNQLMGIARRKAGTVVRCPTCAGQVVVPNPGTVAPDSAAQEPSAEEAPLPQPAPAAPRLFEQSNFGEEFFPPDLAVPRALGDNGGFLPVPPLPVAPAAAAVAPPDLPPAPDLGFTDPAPAPPGILLTPARATILADFVVLLVGVAFFAGMLVGRS
jgi:hypothetical protein